MTERGFEPGVAGVAGAHQLPVGLVPYHRTPDFPEKTVPAALLKSHATKLGTWGLIHVTAGELRLRITDERRVPAELRLAPGDASGVIEPTILHEVLPLGSVEFYVQFYRVDPAAAPAAVEASVAQSRKG